MYIIKAMYKSFVNYFDQSGEIDIPKFSENPYLTKKEALKGISWIKENNWNDLNDPSVVFSVITIKQ